MKSSQYSLFPNRTSNLVHNSFGINPVNVLNLHIIDLARKYYTHLQREIEKEEAR
jgi:hypothetical protein